MRQGAIGLAVALVVALATARSATAHAPSGAIFTTLADGSEVNVNLFPTKESVYLDGGPGPGAPATAAGLDDGTYVFQITDPSGKTLLSTDPARCRQFTVSGGLISGVVDVAPLGVAGCEHVTGTDTDHGAKTVQMMPYDNTTNPGGVYKARVTRLDDFLDGCNPLSKPNGLDLVDCGHTPGNPHGFVPAHSKTDNFKVRDPKKVYEIDVFFFNDRNGDGHRWDWDAEELLPGIRADWTDTLGVTNVRYSDPNYRWGLMAHVEALEIGVHYIKIMDQPGCKVGLVHGDNWVDLKVGPQTVPIEFFRSDKDETTHRIYVACTVTP